MPFRPQRAAWLPLLALSAALAAPAAANPPGFAFLEVPGGARAASMGGAYASLARGAEAAFWNPAGLGQFEGSQFTATHTETYDHLRNDQAALAGRFFGGGIAASVRALYSEPIPERDDLGNQTGTFGSHDLEFLAGYGRHLSSGMSFGLSTQVVRERIADLGATTWAVNAGTTYDIRDFVLLPEGRVSLSVHNVGRTAHYNFDGEQGAPVKLPTAIQAGLSIGHATFQNLTARLALEGRATDGRSPILAVGGELDSAVGAAIRFGYRAGDDVATWSTGAGWRSGGLRIDYAFVPSKLELEDTHRFSLTAQF
jgi:hypothetical protein